MLMYDGLIFERFIEKISKKSFDDLTDYEKAFCKATVIETFITEGRDQNKIDELDESHNYDDFYNFVIAVYNLEINPLNYGLMCPSQLAIDDYVRELEECEEEE